MSDYISRRTAIKAIADMPNCYNGFSDTYDKACIIGVLEELAPADVKPVVYGKWIVKGQDIYCSECNAESAYNPFGASKFSIYCPNCGARMDGEADGLHKQKRRNQGG